MLWPTWGHLTWDGSLPSMCRPPALSPLGAGGEAGHLQTILRSPHLFHHLLEAVERWPLSKNIPLIHLAMVPVIMILISQKLNKLSPHQQTVHQQTWWKPPSYIIIVCLSSSSNHLSFTKSHGWGLLALLGMVHHNVHAGLPYHSLAEKDFCSKFITPGSMFTKASYDGTLTHVLQGVKSGPLGSKIATWFIKLIYNLEYLDNQPSTKSLRQSPQESHPPSQTWPPVTPWVLPPSLGPV